MDRHSLPLYSHQQCIIWLGLYSLHTGHPVMTPLSFYQMDKQKQQIESLKGIVSPSKIEEAMGKIIKGAEMFMQNALLLQEIHQPQSENQYKRRRKARTKRFIQNRGSLMVAKAREQAQREQLQAGAGCGGS